MMNEINSDYIHKYNVLRNYLHLIVHEAMKMQPTQQFEKHSNAAVRICHLFFELLERQFPIDSPHFQLKLKTANDFAYGLSVHVNHLNRAVKKPQVKPPLNILVRALRKKPKHCYNTPVGIFRKLPIA